MPSLIVGIGASAGGLDAFKTFFTNMPADDAFAFVLVQHLYPEHVSLLAELIGRDAAMPVTEAVDGDRVAAGHVYVIPPNATLTISEGVLHVTKPAPPRQQRWPINSFFASLAKDRGESAVCIVLAGTGSDGALGLRTVREHGGLTLAQAGFDHAAMSGMPASAVSTGLVDDILPVEEMPARLIAYLKHLQPTRLKDAGENVRHAEGEHLDKLFRLLRAGVGHDFSQYKRSTLLRRIQRRMRVQQTETMGEYVSYLEQHPLEHQRLFAEMLIGVTEFFRDSTAFDTLRDMALPAILAGKGAADTVRIWVPGCATGEEVYSIAILVREAIGSQRAPKVQIFATDIDAGAIDIARGGRYRVPLQGISAERLDRWFIREGDGYCVVKQVREMCIFSLHSVIKDPPFSRLDLVSCRNVLIYFNTELQERLFQSFHYALQPGAFLLLGPTESLGRSDNLFVEVDKKHRLYVRRDNSRPNLPPLPQVHRRRATEAERAAQGAASATAEGAERNVQRIIEKYAPAYVIIDTRHDVLRFAGETGRYLSPSSGAASLNVFALVHKRLREPARAAVREALSTNATVIRDGLAVEIDGHQQSLRLIAEPLAGDDGKAALCVLAFDERPVAPLASALPAEMPATEAAVRIQALEHELESVRTQLFAAIELYESANEELKSANEEYQSVNEELQSANEELETSKEEMQSINEELQIVNAEAHGKNEKLARLNSDLLNLMDSTQIATLFLDRDMRIGGYTPAITELFHLRDGDRGRPVTEISARINYPELKQDVTDVLRHLGVVERTLYGDPEDRVYLLHMRAYRTVEHVIDGVVLTFVDITQNRRHEVERERLAAIVNSSRDAIIGYALDDSVTSWNTSAERIFGYSAVQMLGQPVSKLLPAEVSDLAKAAVAESDQNMRPEEFETVWRTRDGRAVPVAVTNSLVRSSEGEILAGSLIVRDITDRRQIEAHARMMLGELNHRVKNTLASIQAIALQTLAGASTMRDFQGCFLSRLQALSDTHSLLAADAWHGIDLSAIILGELAPYQSDPSHSRVRMNGEDVFLTPKIALALSMAVHELTTNAMKYGALSVPNGIVDVHWTVAEENPPSLLLRWQESGGPTVHAPVKRNFGSRLITDGLAFELDGRVTLEFNPSGVRCEIAIPLTGSEAML